MLKNPLSKAVNLLSFMARGAMLWEPNRRQAGHRICEQGLR